MNKEFRILKYSVPCSLFLVPCLPAGKSRFIILLISYKNGSLIDLLTGENHFGPSAVI